MAELLYGKPVADALAENLKPRLAALTEKNITPTLSILRLGENAGNASYERGIRSRAAALGVAVVTVALPEDAPAELVLDRIDALNQEDSVHGVLLLRPLPEHLRSREQEIFNRLDPRKDVDGMTALSAAGVYTGQPLGFPPCTAAACMKLLSHYGVALAGKRAAVLGRSLVIGRPVAMLLQQKNATVTMLHSGTGQLREELSRADILICAAGVKGLVTEQMVRPGQIILDVSMNYDPEKPTPRGKGGMVGDCDFEAVSQIVAAVTPVPGGVGAVTNTVLMEHLIQASENAGGASHHEETEKSVGK